MTARKNISARCCMFHSSRGVGQWHTSRTTTPVKINFTKCSKIAPASMLKSGALISTSSQGYGQHWRGARTRHNLMSKMKTSVKLILTGVVVVHLAVLRAYNVSEASRASSRPFNTDNIGGPVTLRMLSLLRSEIIRTTLTIIVPITRAMCVCFFFMRPFGKSG